MYIAIDPTSHKFQKVNSMEPVKSAWGVKGWKLKPNSYVFRLTLAFGHRQLQEKSANAGVYVCVYIGSDTHNFTSPHSLQ